MRRIAPWILGIVGVLVLAGVLYTQLRLRTFSAVSTDVIAEETPGISPAVQVEEVATSQPLTMEWSAFCCGFLCSV